MEAAVRESLRAEHPHNLRLAAVRVQTEQQSPPGADELAWAQVAGDSDVSPFRIGLSVCVANDLVDSLLGFRPGAGRGLTRTDQAVLAHWVRHFVRALLGALGEHVGTAPLHVHWSAESEAARGPHSSARSSRFARLEFEASCGSEVGPLIAEFALAAIKRRLLAAVSRNTPAARERIRANVLDATARVVATMGSAAISLRDLSTLEVGDIIRFSETSTTPARLSVNGRELFVGMPGIAEEMLAVQVTAACDDVSSARAQAGADASESAGAEGQPGAMRHE